MSPASPTRQVRHKAAARVSRHALVKTLARIPGDLLLMLSTAKCSNRAGAVHLLLWLASFDLAPRSESLEGPVCHLLPSGEAAPPPRAKRALRGELRVSRSFPFRRRPWSKVTGTASFSKIERLLAQARLGGAAIISACPVKSAAFSGLSGLGAHMKKCSSERLRSESSESSASSQKPPLKVSVQTCQASQPRGLGQQGQGRKQA